MLESPGGAAADYGLAAQMMLRLSHEPGLVVTVCVDRVAASGGYVSFLAGSCHVPFSPLSYESSLFSALPR
jgi:ClpP class serine protease